MSKRRLPKSHQKQHTAPDENFIMLPTVDFCFKELMKNEKVRKGFIAALLNENPEILEETELLSGELPREYEDEKLGILDVLVRFRNGKRMNLEMQVLTFDYWQERVLFYLGKVFTGQLKKGEPYSILQKCVHVSILDFQQFPEDHTCFRSFHLREDVSGQLYSDKLEIIVMELPKLPPKARTEKEVIKWMRFFNCKRKEDFIKMAETDTYIEEAYRELERLSADESHRLEYEAREKALRDYITLMESANNRGMAKGMAKGMEKGIAEGEERVNRLNRLLLASQRYDDLEKSAHDTEYQKQLFEEFHL